MKQLAPYLMFKGNCKEAMTYYGECFKQKVEIMPSEDQKTVMHASIKVGSFYLMASDWSSNEFDAGNNVQIYIDCHGRNEVNELHASLGKGGKSTMNPEDVFWGSYFGSVIDKFGIHWMMAFDEPKK